MHCKGMDRAEILRRIHEVTSAARELGCTVSLSNASPEVLAEAVALGGNFYTNGTDTRECDWVDLWNVPEFRGLHFVIFGEHRPKADKPLSGDLRGDP